MKLHFFNWLYSQATPLTLAKFDLGGDGICHGFLIQSIVNILHNYRVQLCCIAIFTPGFCLSQETLPGKFKLNCTAGEYGIQKDLSSPLERGKLRRISPALSPFVGASSYTSINGPEVTTKKRIECSKGNQKICAEIYDDHLCEEPKNTFAIRSISKDNSIIMVQNRCKGGFIKYSKLDLPDNQSGSLIYMDERFAFQLKNQIRATEEFASFTKPLLVISAQSDSSATLYIESFYQSRQGANDTEESNDDESSSLKENLKEGLEEGVDVGLTTGLIIGQVAGAGAGLNVGLRTGLSASLSRSGLISSPYGGINAGLGFSLLGFILPKNSGYSTTIGPELLAVLDDENYSLQTNCDIQ